MLLRSAKITIILLLIALVAPATAGLFGPPTATVKGRINFIQPTNFTVLTDSSQIVRIMVASDKKIPPQIQLGVYVELTAILGQDNQWYLDKFDRVQLQPNQ